MNDLFAQVLVAFNVLGVISATIYFVSSMGAKIERLGEAIQHLAIAQERQQQDHEQRIRALEQR
jgi:hypothetical protein